jgi:hypothetical protein
MMVHNNKRTSISALAAAVLLSVFAVVVASAARADALTYDPVQITSATIDPKTGDVRIEGPVGCGLDYAEGPLVSMDPIVVSQQQGNRIVQGYDDPRVLCTEQPSSFVVTTLVRYEPEDGIQMRFHPGRATVTGPSLSGGPFFGPIAVRLEPSRSV